MERLKGWKLVVNNCVNKPKPLWSNSWYNYLKGEAFVEVFVSPYAADHNLLPHLQNIHRDGTPRCFLLQKTEKHAPDPLSKTQTQLQHQVENVQHTSQDQTVESFLGSEQRYWLRASFT